MAFPKARVRAGAATAALWLGAGLLLAGSPSHDAKFPQAVCLHPREIASTDGWTTEVSCLPSTSPAVALRGPARLLFGLTLDLNRADARTLEVLPQIGPARAAAIVREREQAKFSSVEELVRVRGIGPKTLAGLIGWVGVGEAR